MAYMPNVIAAAMPRLAEKTRFLNIVSGIRALSRSLCRSTNSTALSADPTNAAMLPIDSQPHCEP